MINLIDLEKKINSELTTKIKKTEIKHDQIYLEIDKNDLIDVILFIKTNKDLKYFTMPSQKRIEILRNIIAPKVLNFYPQFAKKIWFNQTFLKSFLYKRDNKLN